MEITNTKKLTAEQIVRALNSKGYLYYGESARVWNGNTQARIYFGRDFVTILPSGTITNDQSGKRTLTIGDEAVEAIRDIVAPCTPAEETQEKSSEESATITTTTTRGTEVVITLTADTITAEVSISPFGKFTTAAEISPLKGQFALLGKVPTGENLFITIPENVIEDIIEKRQHLKQNQEERLFPGITNLRELKRKWDDAWEKREKALEDNNGLPGQKFIDEQSIYEKLEEARSRHPRAALALTAESYIGAGHIDKSIAGDKALELLKNGGSMEEAQLILDNWLSKEAMWD